MSNSYQDLYEKFVIAPHNGVVLSYDPISESYTFQAFSHLCSTDCMEKLAQLLRDNLVFYCYGEEEVCEMHSKNQLDDLKNSTRYAYKSRLPHRNPVQDGLPGELLLDYIVQSMNPNAQKLCVRTIFRQKDNFEIKGYDLTYFQKVESGYQLWLGQSKLGAKSYCRAGIHDDLVNKYNSLYLADQLFFVADKPFGISKDAKQLLQIIQDINHLSIDIPSEKRAEMMVDYFVNNNISIKIPCLLAYDDAGTYLNSSTVESKVKSELDNFKAYYLGKKYNFGKLPTEIVFFVFPISDLKKLRSKDEGFYCGLL